ncbi:glycosyltransferase family 2 protein [Kineococcus sp. SYSU DK003]|uniref:glycosyltransferase family 2 protein n=1 Tax=Kineococcus sp. SYSU DK003 TaxID=3383124 RepID=UPI003D7DEB79
MSTTRPSDLGQVDRPAPPGRADRHRDTWVVIPLFREESAIEGVLDELRDHFAHVVCVDDGSPDASAARAEAGGATVVRHGVNLGQGAALQTGISYALRDAGMRSVVTFDADGQHCATDASAMVDKLEREGLDVVFGSRFLDDRTEVDRLRRTVLRMATVYTNATTKVPLTDAHNGLRVLSRRAAATVRLRHDRMAHATEIVQQVGRSDLRWAEHPVEIRYTDYSRSKGQSLLNSVNILVDTLLG